MATKTSADHEEAVSKAAAKFGEAVAAAREYGLDITIPSRAEDFAAIPISATQRAVDNDKAAEGEAKAAEAEKTARTSGRTDPTRTEAPKTA